MLPGLMAYNNHDYGRWLPDYLAMLSSLSVENILQHSLPYSATQPLDRNNYESELKAKAVMLHEFADSFLPCIVVCTGGRCHQMDLISNTYLYS